MKQKKILAGLAAAAMALSLSGVSVFAAGLNNDSEDIEDEEVEEEILDEEAEEAEDELDDLDDEDFEDLDEDEDFDDFDDFDDEEEEEDEDEASDDIVIVEAEAKDESPKTGNAPIALAVIPVALAAAAVIAKKSK